MTNPFPWFVAVISGLACLSSAAAGDDDKTPIRTQPPTATFVIADGWLTIRVLDGDKPLSGVAISCLVGSTVWASGETDAEGRGSFPKPKAEWCQLVFDLGAGSSAPVPLTFLKDGTVVPASSPIFDGTAACCIVPNVRVPRVQSSSMLTDEETRGLTWLIVLGASLVAGIGYVLIVRPQHAKHKTRRYQK